MTSASAPRSPSLPVRAADGNIRESGIRKQQMKSNSTDFDKESVIGPPGASGGGRKKKEIDSGNLQRASAVINGQGARDAFGNESKDGLHGESGADDIVHDKRTETYGNVMGKTQAKAEIGRYFTVKRLELVDGFTDVTVKDIHHRKTGHGGQFLAEVKGVGRISQMRRHWNQDSV